MFSVIIVCYNNDEYLTTAIDAVLGQDYSEIELIVADDCSREFDRDKYFNYIKNGNRGNIKQFAVYSNPENYGTVKNINTALKKCSGRYIKVTSADDSLYDSHTLSNAAQALDKSSCGLVIADVEECDSQLSPVRKYESRFYRKMNSLSAEAIFKRLCIHNDIHASSVFYSADFLAEYGYFDESYRLLEDWPKWLEVTSKGGHPDYFSFFAEKYRTNVGSGTSINKFYLSDKNRVLNSVIIPSKKRLGFFYYTASRASFAFVNSIFIRKLYGFLFR